MGIGVRFRWKAAAMEQRFRLSVCSVAFLFLCPIPLSAVEQTKPNIVYVLADDLGYGDVGCYNPASKIPTPNMDRLATEGVRFTDAHSPSSVCTPTRYALLTGRYAWRTRLQRNVLGPFSQPLIAERQLTVPGMLREQGYATACIGKWHLGWGWTMPGEGERRNFEQPISDGPTTRGFDHYFGTDVPNYPPYCFIDNDRTVGIPSEMAPVGRDSFNHAGPMVAGWQLVDVLPGLEQHAAKYIETARTMTSRSSCICLSRRRTIRWFHRQSSGEEQGRQLRRFCRADRSRVGDGTRCAATGRRRGGDAGDLHEPQRPGDYRRSEPRSLRPAAAVRTREHGNAPRREAGRLGRWSPGAVHCALAGSHPGGIRLQ